MAQERSAIEIERPSTKVSDFFGQNVFNVATMQRYLSQEAYESVMLSMKEGKKIDMEMADQVAAGMKSWAIDMGCTHHTHWFQPLTGLTAEKHDTFFAPIDASKGIEKFNGKQLVQGEPDGSSFPSGGMRSTHEARGYTAWDPSSPAFVMEVGTVGKTLCIPTIFISYSGGSMGYKAPLLKSQHAINEAAVKVCQFFDRNVTRVVPTLGWEQEYFLVDAALFNARPDLIATGRAILGRPPARGQQLDDHYFGSIPERVQTYMLDLETQAWKLGIPISTRHNEVAPGQYEFAPVFDEVNRAVDQNSLLMDLMDRVARRHNLRVLMHEKPFAGLNGSGKHNNWSLGTDTGVNLLSPGKTPRKSLQFLSFFVNTIRAISEYSDLLRASIASAANDYRLGGHEAPPAIFSVFIGSTLTAVLDEIEKKVKKGKMPEGKQDDLKLDIHNMIPDVLLDNTDRNRTSPFAFTGNKFEMRAVGSSANCAFPMTVLNTIVAQQLNFFHEEVKQLINKKEKRDAAILRVLRRYVKESRAILFEGDNYSAEWRSEAKKRGLNNVTATADALDFFLDPKSVKLFTEYGIFSKEELHARYEVLQDNYKLKVQIEAEIMDEMINNQIIPACIAYGSELTSQLVQMKGLGIPTKSSKQFSLLTTINKKMNVISAALDKMAAEMGKAEKKDAPKAAKHYNGKVKPLMQELRTQVDELELIVSDQHWPLPKYRELLFIK